MHPFLFFLIASVRACVRACVRSSERASERASVFVSCSSCCHLASQEHHECFLCIFDRTWSDDLRVSVVLVRVFRIPESGVAIHDVWHKDLGHFERGEVGVCVRRCLVTRLDPKIFGGGGAEDCLLTPSGRLGCSVSENDWMTPSGMSL